jgi:O-antigen ligase
MKNSFFKILITIFSFVLAFYLARASLKFGATTLLAAVAFFVALAVSFTRGTDGLYFIAAAILFSPEIGAGVETGRRTGEGAGGIVLRLEDILLIAVGLGWLLRTTYYHRRFGIIKTPINGSIGAYMMISLIATFFGVTLGNVKIETGIIHNLKYFEYFFLYFMILAHVRNKQTISRLITFTLIVFGFAIIYGYTQIKMDGITRVCAPFDAEPNTFGAYIVLIMSIAFGIVLCNPRFRVQFWLTILILAAMPPLLFTLSRSSYLAFLTTIVAFLVASKKRILIGTALIGTAGVFILGVPMLPKPVVERIMYTFQKGSEYHYQVAGIDLDSSTSARIDSYKRALEIWWQSPIIGHGVTGTHFIDGQYMRLLAETGIIGLATFLFMIWRLLKETWNIYLNCDDKYLKGAVLGFFCGIIGMLAHALSANTFIIIRVAEPFWLLAGLIMLIPRIREQPEEEEWDARPVRVIETS